MGVKVFNCFFIFILLRIVYGEDLHKVVGGVGESWDWLSNPPEVGGTPLGITLINDVSITHQDQPIKVMECLRAGLMDRAHDSLALVAS